MRSARAGFPLVIIAVAALLNGCASIDALATPASSTGATSGPATTAVASDAPASQFLVTTAPSSVLGSQDPSTLPTIGPTLPPTQEPTQTPGLANLVVTKLAVPDSLQVGVETEAKVTIKNKGEAEAARFSVVMTVAMGDDTPVLRSDAIEIRNPIVGGATKQVSFALSLAEPGDYSITVTVDSDDDIDEANEDDNSAVTDVTAIALPNLTIEGNSFTVEYDQGYDRLKVVLLNTGPATISDPFFVRFLWTSSDGTQSGELGEFELGPPIPMGKRVPLDIPVPGVGSGDFSARVVADSRGQITETDETDNEETAEFSNP